MPKPPPRVGVGSFLLGGFYYERENDDILETQCLSRTSCKR